MLISVVKHGESFTDPKERITWELSDEEFVSRVVESWEKSRQLVLEGKKSEWHVLNDGFSIPDLEELLMGEERVLIECNSCQPKIKVKVEPSNCWMIIRFVWTLEDIAKQAQGFFICFRSLSDLPWEFLRNTETVSIDSDGVIRIWRGGLKLMFPAFIPPWPEPMKFPERYYALGALNAILEEEDANPLTILLNTDQPYKGLAKQLAGTLEKIRANL